MQTWHHVSRIFQPHPNNINELRAQSAVYCSSRAIDELGYLPFSQPGGQLLFHLISKLYENTSLLITTNLAFADWPQVFGEPNIARCYSP
jgi:IstB-like ATP binding protein